jgi:hypothetical protein
MMESKAFLISMGIAFVMSVLIAGFMRLSLLKILTDLTGSRERAAFWTMFSSILLVLVPLTTCMFVYQDTSEKDVFPGVIRMLRWSLIGMIATLLFMGGTIIAFVAPLSVEERRPELQRPSMPSKD